MTDDAEFTSYAASRWSALVRVAVLLGRPPGHAAVLAAEALGRQREVWALREEHRDLDVTLYLTLLDVVAGDRAAWWAHVTLDDREALATSGLLEIEAALDALNETNRARLVLIAVPRLSPEQVDDVLAHRATTSHAHGGGPAPESVSFVAEGLVPAPFGGGDIVAVAASRGRRRRLMRAATAIAVVAALVAAGSVAAHQLNAAGPLIASTSDLSSTPSPTRPPSQRPDQSDAPARGARVPVAWAAEGRLHLGRRVVVLDQITSLASTSRAVVATLSDGRLVQPFTAEVAAGAVSELGSVRVGDRAVASTVTSFAAWVARREPPKRPRLIVRDLDSGTDLVTRPVSSTSRVVALDGYRIYVSDDEGYVLTELLADAVPLHVAGVRLLDAANGVLATAPKRDVVRLAAPRAPSYEVPGQTASLSQDGQYAAIQAPSGVSTRSGWSILDVKSGTTVVLPLPQDALIESVAFAPGQQVVLAVTSAAERPLSIGNDQPQGQGPVYDLITCDLFVRDCRRDVRLTHSSEPPVLAQ